MAGLPMGKSLPCIQKGCSMCCRETTMPITGAEASRLSRRTGMAEEDFCNKDESGIRRLLNNQFTKACVFLATESDLPTAAGMCSVYESRPLGCRTYPIILDSNNSAVLDDNCPYNEDFEEPDDDDTHRLLILESKLKR